MYTLETAGNRHIHLKVALDSALSDVRWDSDTDSLPQSSTGIDLGGTATEIYVLAVMNWVNSSGGGSSPFPVGTPPFLNSLGLDFTFAQV